MRLISVSDSYIDYLRVVEKRVMDNKVGIRKHTRKYLGVFLKVNNYNYFIPLSSPKKYDYVKNGVIRKSNMFCSRMFLNDGNNHKHLYGKLMYKYMIPIPDNAIINYDVNKEKDLKYKDVVKNELVWISLHIGEIYEKSKKIYRYQTNTLNLKDPRHQKILNFKLLEKYCEIYKRNVK